ncbi:hypothetical protein [Nocardia sp. NPDC127526]|uniref:hypothetical protein n=1 Tax=Nocardia sp. NPDC127526 TaxID=3345393 RepID=UPI003626CA06
MEADDALALIGGERAAGWLQYHDGSWAPVWRDGRIGSPFTFAELIELAVDDVAAFESGPVDQS